MRIEIKKEINAETREVWTFNMFYLNAVFVAWHKEVKPKGKRTWKIVEFWDNYGRKEFTMVNEPQLPDSVREEVLTEVLKWVKVNTWKEWKTRG